MTDLEKLVKKAAVCMAILRPGNTDYIKIHDIPDEEMKEARIRYLLDDKVLDYLIISIDKQNNSIELISL